MPEKSRVATVAMGLMVVLAVGGGCSNDGCTRPLSASGCMPTLDAQTSTIPVGSCASVGTCGPYKVFLPGPNYVATTCVYDGSGQHLISATTCSDIAEFCDNTSSCVSAGSGVDVSKTCDVSALPKTCSALTGG